MTKAKDLRDQTIEELEFLCGNAKKELFLLRCEKKSGAKMAKPHRVGQQRKEIAKLLTVMHEKRSALK